MNSVPLVQEARVAVAALFVLLLFASPIARLTVSAQTPDKTQVVDSSTISLATKQTQFRLEHVPVSGGGELLTIFGSLNAAERADQTTDVPLVSILRDTLGDDLQENDRLRYVWMLTYTRPSAIQRAAAAVPFFYNRLGNKQRASQNAPPPVIDLAATDHDVWQRLLWTALQNLVLDPLSLTVKASTRTYRRNADDYHKGHIVRALAILSLYEAESGARPAFTSTEMREIQARLMLTEASFGGLIDDVYLQRVQQHRTTEWRDVRGHNWELLRQHAEAEGLYFDPLELPDGSATHAMLWVARQDLADARDRRYNKRFLNIANPWGDERLSKWEGYTERRYFDAENRLVPEGTNGARVVEMIPLALYGLDHPKVPALLIDFRDGMNPKQREMSRRVLEDVARNLLLLSRFGDIHYLLGRTVYDFVTNRRGMDLNQPSRLRTYSQLKLLLSLHATLDPQLRDELSRRLERVSVNPLENDSQAEARLAREQYQALLAYANKPHGLPAQLDLDRRTEMTQFVHGRAERILFRLGHIVSFGSYTHREEATPQRLAQLNLGRQLAYHQRFLREAAKSSPRIEIVWNMGEVRRSLQFVMD
ncbi:MAG: hypothetical protein H0T92_18430, partial [Pyrinomonadaceae bacterium]|nr:hypothetical protein [Pyrinomonadaceae bacterium]